MDSPGRMHSYRSGDAPMIEKTTVIRRNPRVAYRDLADGSGAVLLHLDTGAYHGVNALGELIWSLLEQPRAVERLLAAARSQVEDPPPTFDEEITNFIQGLWDRDLVQVEGQPPNRASSR
jgi:hypothetical protein